MGTESYTLSRGELHFSKYKPGTQIGEGYRYLGNSQEWTLNAEVEMLDHFNSDRGIKQKDKSIPLTVTRTGSTVLDEITSPNIGLYLFSPDGATTVTETGGAITGFAISDVIPGRSYQLGESDTNPVGDMKISPTGFVVKKGSTIFDIMDDYVVDFTRGLLTIVEGGAIVVGDDITVDYTVLASTYELVVSGDDKVEGAMKYIEFNPAGANKVWTFPYVSISPNGEMTFKGDDWQSIPLNIEVLAKNTMAAIYVNGVPQ
jgi:hypothetical protein